MTETQWRFLKAIADRVADGGIVELRLFPAIRQGGAESGVAVVAVEETFLIPDPAVDDAALSGALPAATVSGDDQLLGQGGGEQLQLRAIELDSVEGADDIASIDDNLSALANFEHHYTTPELIVLVEALPRSDVPPQTASTIDARATGDVATLHLSADDGMPSQSADDRATDHEVALNVSVDGADRADPEAGSLASGLDLGAVPPPASLPRHKRYAVLAARYRLTLKGPDRGHWDFEIRHEADAPLDTVDRVARGVARRAGDEGEPETFSAYQLRSTLSQPWWNSAT